MTALASAAVHMLGASQNQQIGIAVARQQVTAEKAVAGMVAAGASQAQAGPPAPAGQGQSVDLRV